MDKKSVTDVEVILLEDEPVLSIGSAYQADIFYQYHNQIPQKWCVFCYEKHLPQIRFVDNDINDRYTGEAGLKAGKYMPLFYGQILAISGLHIGYFGKYLFMWTDKGDIRISYRKRRLNVSYG